MYQFNLVQLLSHVWLFETPWTAANQASLSIINSQSLLNLMSIESVMPSSHLILCHPLLLLPPIPPSIRVFSNESTLGMRWPKSCPTLCKPRDSSTPGFPVLHYLQEFVQTHVHWVDDAIQPSQPLSSPCPALNLSQHQGLFQWVNSLHVVAKVLEFQPQHQSFQWTPRTGLLWDGLVGSLWVQGTLKSLLQHHSQVYICLINSKVTLERVCGIGLKQ